MPSQFHGVNELEELLRDRELATLLDISTVFYSTVEDSRHQHRKRHLEKQPQNNWYERSIDSSPQTSSQDQRNFLKFETFAMLILLVMGEDPINKYSTRRLRVNVHLRFNTTKALSSLSN